MADNLQTSVQSDYPRTTWWFLIFGLKRVGAGRKDESYGRKSRGYQIELQGVSRPCNGSQDKQLQTQQESNKADGPRRSGRPKSAHELILIS